MMEILRKDTKLLTLAATLMIHQLFGGKDDAFIAEQQRAMAEAQELIHQGQAALQENNLSEATDRFIAGYWKFRQIYNDIYCYSVPGSKFTPHVVNKPTMFPDDNRGCMPRGPIEMGCWLNNSLHHQKVPWLISGPGGEGAQGARYKGKSCSNRIKKFLAKSFSHPKIKCIRDCGNWLQSDYCKPVSSCLLEHFKSLPQDAHELINILELYKCYIECDCGYPTQCRFAQHNYKEVYEALYPWFANIIKETLTASENSDMHIVLTSIFYNCDAEMSDFTDATSLSGEKIRGLGGYQIDTPKILRILQDPNFQDHLINNGASRSARLAEQIRTCGTKWEAYQEQSRREAHIYKQMIVARSYY